MFFGYIYLVTCMSMTASSRVASNQRVSAEVKSHNSGADSSSLVIEAGELNVDQAGQQTLYIGPTP